MSNPHFKIVSHPDFACISPQAIVSYEAKCLKNDISQHELDGIKFRWFCYNDPATLSFWGSSIFTGPKERNWKNAKWAFVGRHRIVLKVKYPNGDETVYSYAQWVDTASNILKREFNPHANDRQLGPFQVLKSKENYYQVLLNIAKAKPPPANKQAEHNKRVEKNKGYIGHLKDRLNGLEGCKGIAVDAWHMDRENSHRTPLSLWLVKIADKEEPTWTLVDWTNPSYKYATGVYTENGDTDKEALEDVISEWDSDNRYPDGFIRYEFSVPDYGIKLTGEFETDGKSFWDTVSSWFDYIALGAAVVAGVVTLVAPVPGSRVVSAAIWTAIFTSTAAATINIAQRHSEGFANWQDDLFDGLSIIGNIFAAGAAWKIGMGVTSATRLGSNMTKAILIGQVSTDGLQGILLASQHIGTYNAIMDDSSLSPDERLKKLLELLASAAVTGTLTYISVKGTTGDLNNLNNNRTLLSKADIENPDKLIDLDIPVSSVPIAENQKQVTTVVETEPKHKPVNIEETPNAGVPLRVHPNDELPYSKSLEARVKQRATTVINDPSFSNRKRSAMAATSRSGVNGKHFPNGKHIESPDFENLGKEHFKQGKSISGAKRSDGNFLIENIDEYIIYVKKLYKESGNPLHPFTENLIKQHIRANNSFSNLHGLPGLHAEIQSANHVFKQLTNQGVDLKTYNLSNIEVATYKVHKPDAPEGSPFEACQNCGAILRPPITILTGRR